MAQRREAPEFDGFLSYSHADSSALAADVQRVLHAIARPWYRLRAARVFRDRSNVAPSDSLWGTIQRALESSAHFLLLASPAAARSPWVARELEWWLAHRGTERLILIVTAGDVVWRPNTSDFDPDASTALPPVLRAAFRDEPLWVDLSFAEALARRERRDRLRTELLPVAARLHGKSPDALGGEDVKRRRTAYTLAASTAMATVALTSYGLYSANLSSLEAEAARQSANAQAARAERERLDRIANVALRSVAADGLSAEPVAQLGHVARSRPGAEGQVQREVLGYWLQALAPLGTLLRDGQVVNWRDRTLAMVDGRIVRLEGGRKGWAAWSRVPGRLFAADRSTGQLVLIDARSGRQIATFDISALVADSLQLLEPMPGEVLIIRGKLQSSSAGGAYPRLGLASLRDGGIRWFKPEFEDGTVRADGACRRFEVKQDKELVEVRLVAGAAPQIRVLPGDGAAAGLRPMERSCDAHALAAIEGLKADLAFPARQGEVRHWQPAAAPTAPAAATDSPDSLTERERAEWLPALQRARQRLEEALRASAAAKPGSTREAPDPLAAETARAVRFRSLVDEIERGGPAIRIQTPAGPVLVIKDSGMKYGVVSLCRLPVGDRDPVCVDYKFHVFDWAPEAWSPSGRYLMLYDFAFVGHRSFGLLDVHEAAQVQLADTPDGIAIASAFAGDERALAVLTDQGELAVYRLRPVPALVRKLHADIARRAREELPGPSEAPCLHLREEVLLYCNAKGGLTALSTATGETLWVTPRIAQADQVLRLTIGEGVIAAAHTPTMLRLLRIDDGAMLTDPLPTMALAQRAALEEARLGSAEAVLVRIGDRWFKRLPPRDDVGVRRALDALSCWTGLATGAAMSNAEVLDCRRPMSSEP
jgi:TIR domain